MRTRGSNGNLVRVVLLLCSCATGMPALGGPSRGEPSFVPGKTVLESPRVTTQLVLRKDSPVLSVRINGAGPFSMLLDSTARAMVVDDRVVRDAGLTTLGRFDKSALIPPGVDSADLVHIHFLSIGEAEFLDFDAIAVDLDALVEYRRPYDGVLPLSFFSGALLTLDYPAGQLILERGELPAPDGETVLPYTDANGLPMVKLALADLSLDVVVDTTSRMAFTFPPDLKEQVVDAYGQAPAGRRMGPVKKVDDGAAGRLRIGRHEVSYPPFEIEAGLPSIGGMILRQFAITFDQKHHRVRFARRDTAPIRFSFLPKYGVELELRRNRMVVVAIFPDSPMDKSYIKVGSEVTMIDRRSALEYTPSALRWLMERSDSLVFNVDADGVGLIFSVRAVPR